MINKEDIKKLREKTGLGVLDCQRILKETSGNIEKAIAIAREKFKKAVVKKSERETKQGIIVSYIHTNKKVGVLLEILCETDFVAKNEEFLSLGRDLAVHIAAMAPEFLSPKDAPKDLSKEEKEARALLSQNYFKDPAIKVNDIISEKIQKFGENVKIGRFVRYQI